ncbi:phosphoenolpyruvate--protein phosphotransferase [Thermosulfuriphilus sp.]
MKEGSIKLKGIGASPGIAIGEVFLIDRGRIKVVQRPLSNEEELELEVARLKTAISQALNELKAIKDKIPGEILGQSSIIDAHLLILNDPLLIDRALSLIRQERINAEWALVMALREIEKVFSGIEDEYFRNRYQDVQHVVDRILGILTGAKPADPTNIPHQAIVVAHDLSPADTIQMKPDRVLALLTDMGSRTSHTAIVARSLGIPAVVGLERITDLVSSGSFVIVDGLEGLVIIEPSSEEIARYEGLRDEFERFRLEIVRAAHLPAETLDGQQIKVKANIELLEEIPVILEHGAEGVGLFRTEFLYLNRITPPGEEELYQVYKEVVERMAPFPVTIRTLDIGGDKLAKGVPQAKETNPALGLRSIRLCLKEQDLFRCQLRAILRASIHGKLRIMFPMVSGLEELLEAKALLSEVAEELRQQGLPLPQIPIGAMIEVPTAVAIADILAREVDFFSIGTNDLIQYSLAIDRVNEHVAHLYEPLHPGILRMIRQVTEVGHESGIEVGMCGEMAGELLYVPLLVGLGLDELSMNALSIPRVKKLIRCLKVSDCQELARETLRLATPEAIKELLLERLPKILPENFADLLEKAAA